MWNRAGSDPRGIELSIAFGELSSFGRNAGWRESAAGGTCLHRKSSPGAGFPLGCVPMGYGHVRTFQGLLKGCGLQRCVRAGARFVGLASMAF
jgi:hypothetical protein